MARSSLLSFFKKQLAFKKPLESLLFLGLILLILFLVNKFVLPLLNLNIENFENDSSKKLVYFYMDGCGHCEKFLPIWNEFIKNNNSSISTHKIERKEAGNKIDKYNINGFPTLLVLDEKNNKVKEYNGERTVGALTEFINNL